MQQRHENVITRQERTEGVVTVDQRPANVITTHQRNHAPAYRRRSYNKTTS